ncbi:hypothetical protein T492DRAFT_1112885 [Pavlovales sp. CCMP2436]|nr:hypothetical protein T492DRAFT_1112899 [Pavlovales sp. CCMP2436]KAJ1615563.1 hypothetical protein T492DRAFT_1112885 [Pavlovales sp. CCMP2436]
MVGCRSASPSSAVRTQGTTASSTARRRCVDKMVGRHSASPSSAVWGQVTSASSTAHKYGGNKLIASTTALDRGMASRRSPPTSQATRRRRPSSPR